MGVGGDKGLCGGVNSSIVKQIRNEILSTEGTGQTAQVVLFVDVRRRLLLQIYSRRLLHMKKLKGWYEIMLTRGVKK